MDWVNKTDHDHNKIFTESNLTAELSFRRFEVFLNLVSFQICSVLGYAVICNRESNTVGGDTHRVDLQILNMREEATCATCLHWLKFRVSFF